MDRNASRALVLALLLAGVITSYAQRDYHDQRFDLIRFLATKPWAGRGHNRWDRAPRFDADLTDHFTKDRWVKPHVTGQEDARSFVDDDVKMDDNMGENLTAEVPEYWDSSSKRSAVATVLNGRKRRQPDPSAGILGDMGTFFDLIRGNVNDMGSLSQHQASEIFLEPTVVRAPSSGGGGGGGGGGSGMQRLYALRPLRPSNIRTYNRRSLVETDGQYPGANHHDPGLLWTGLGR